jgi:hypothetical protein
MRKWVGAAVLLGASVAVSSAIYGDVLGKVFGHQPRHVIHVNHRLSGDAAEALSEALAELEGLEGLADLRSLEALEALEGLEALEALEGLEGLEALRELEGMDIEIRSEKVREIRHVLREAARNAPAGPQERFQWSGAAAEGGQVEVLGVNGSITAEGYDGSEVVVEAVKSGRRQAPETVRVDVVEHSGGVTVCAVYPGEGNVCAPGGGKMNVKNNDVRVDFVIRVPASMDFVGKTVNGSVRGEALPGDARANTVNGDISVHAAGWVAAQTVNGGIDVIMGSAPEGDLELSTVNGDIALELPSAFDADIDARWLNGGIDSEFQVDLQGRPRARRATATLGAGGPDLDIETVNGTIRLSRGS